MSTRNEQLQMIEDCEKRQEQLTEWEEKFIDEASHILDQGKSLSDWRDGKLTEIWERVTEKG